MRRIYCNSIKSDFKLLHDDKIVADVVYKNWLTGKAQATVNNSLIWLSPKNIWTSKIRIIKDDEEVGEITFTLRGTMVITLEVNGKEINYVLKNVSKLKLELNVYNDAEELQFTMKSKGKWNKLNYDYKIKMADFNNAVDLDELLVYCGYTANLYLAIISSL